MGIVEKAQRILIVDSEADFIEMANRVFSSTFDVSCASTVEEGFKKANRDLPNVIVLGYLKPRGTSRYLANKLAEVDSTKNIPILLVDVRPEEYYRKGWRRGDGFSQNIKGYVWRPINAVELERTVAGILQRAKAGTMNLTEVAEQTEEMLKRIDQLKKLLMPEPEH